MCWVRGVHSGYIRLFIFIELLVGGAFPVANSQVIPAYNQQWTATDGLGRKLADSETCGQPREKKHIGMFYWTWHTDDLADFSPVMNITKIRKEQPGAMSDFHHPAWLNKPEGGVFWWDEPLFGYYRTTDEWVLRKHAEMLADASVDVVFFDCTNGSITWKSSYIKLLEVWSKARKDGVNTPGVAFVLPFANTPEATSTLNELYTELYKPGLYKDLWFYWNGKPLIMAYPEASATKKSSAAMKFTANSTFNNIAIQCGSIGENAELTLKLFKWKESYSESIQSKPIAEKQFSNIKADDVLNLSVENLSKGDYLWELSNPINTVGVWKWDNTIDSSGVFQSFYNGLCCTGSYCFSINYINSPLQSKFTENNCLRKATQLNSTEVTQQRIAEIQEFFTFRPGQPDYVYGPTRNDHWGWLEIAPQHGFGAKPDGGFEQTTVGVAQNASVASDGHACAFNSELTYGRSYTHKNGQDTASMAYLKGLNFQEQWNNAIAINPDLIFVTGWNEWIGGRWLNWDVKPFAFVDTYSAEKSRDIEPVKSWGNKGDVYYIQLINNIRKFKGLKEPDSVSPPKTIRLKNLDDWRDVRPIYASYIGNTMHRNHPGQGKTLIYTNKTGRNDIVEAKVAQDKHYLYFYVKTADVLSAKTDENWMRLFIDIDRDKATGWEGYDYIINRLSPTESAVVEKNIQNSWKWKKSGIAQYSIEGNCLVIKVKRSDLNIEEYLNFEFKWSDNMQENGNVMDFYVNGDVAPGGRFNYIYKQK